MSSDISQPDMLLDDRLKKRVVSQSNKNDALPVGPHRVPSSAANERTRIRKRIRGPRSRNRNSVRCVSRRAMKLASRVGTRKRGYPWMNLKALGFLVIVGVFSFIVFGGDDNKTRRLRKQIRWTPPEFKIFFPTSNLTNSSQTFFQIDAIELESVDARDFGDLELGNLKGQPREIKDINYLSKSEFHHPYQARDDDGNDAYLAFDDDFLRGTTGTLNVQTGQVCHRTSGHRANFQNCNAIYEFNWLENHAKYLK